MLPHPAAPNATDVVQFCPNKSAATSSVTNELMPKSITAVDVGKEEVLTAGLPLLRDVSQMSYNHTVVPRYSLNRKYLLSPVLSTDRLNMLEWISSLTLKGSVTYFGGVYCCSLLLRPVPGLSSRTYGQKSREEEI